MKGTPAWGAQKGTVIYFTAGRFAGIGTVIRVLASRPYSRFCVRTEDGAEYEVGVEDTRYIRPLNRDRKAGYWNRVMRGEIKPR